MRRQISALIAAIAAAVVVDPWGAHAATMFGPICMYSLRDAPPDAPRFEDFPVRPERIAHPAAPRLDSHEARMYRTRLREGAAAGPVFAGHYAVAEWGCGSATPCAAFVDSRTGRVLFFPEIRTVYRGHVDMDLDRSGPGDRTPYYRLNSRLLIIDGMPDEDAKRDGISYFVLGRDRLKLVRFYSAATLCKDAKPYRP
jgi:hypothetical protein